MGVQHWSCPPHLPDVLTEPQAGACVTTGHTDRVCLFQGLDGPNKEQDQGVEKESEEAAGVVPSSPEEWPESPTEEGQGLSPGEWDPEPTGCCGATPTGVQGTPQGPGFPPSSCLPADGLGADTAASGETSPSAR